MAKHRVTAAALGLAAFALAACGRGGEQQAKAPEAPPAKAAPVTTYVCDDGRTVRASRMPPGAEKLLLLGGPGAPEHVGELLLLLAYEPAIARELRSAVWVGHRRWNLVLNNGVEIWLPEEDAVAALKQLVKLDDKHKLLSREFGVVDLRLPDKLYLRKRGPGDATPGPV